MLLWLGAESALVKWIFFFDFNKLVAELWLYSNDPHPPEKERLNSKHIHYFFIQSYSQVYFYLKFKDSGLWFFLFNYSIPGKLILQRILTSFHNFFCIQRIFVYFWGFKNAIVFPGKTPLIVWTKARTVPSAII